MPDKFHLLAVRISGQIVAALHLVTILDEERKLAQSGAQETQPFSLHPHFDARGALEGTFWSY